MPPPSVEKLLEIARNYWPADKEHEYQAEKAPEHLRLSALWEQELGKPERWWGLLDELERELPDFQVGDATSTAGGSFRVAVYPVSNRKLPPVRWAVVGCVSILAPLYTVYGVRYEYSGENLEREAVLFDSLPPEMSPIAELLARKLETTFKASALTRELADTPVPLFVRGKEPPESTLFHALFASRPEKVAWFDESQQ